MMLCYEVQFRIMRKMGFSGILHSHQTCSYQMQLEPGKPLKKNIAKCSRKCVFLQVCQTTRFWVNTDSPRCRPLMVIELWTSTQLFRTSFKPWSLMGIHTGIFSQAKDFLLRHIFCIFCEGYLGPIICVYISVYTYCMYIVCTEYVCIYLFKYKFKYIYIYSYLEAKIPLMSTFFWVYTDLCRVCWTMCKLGSARITLQTTMRLQHNDFRRDWSTMRSPFLCKISGHSILEPLFVLQSWMLVVKWIEQLEFGVVAWACWVLGC